MILTVILFGANGLAAAATLYFAIESMREKQPRAFKVGLAITSALLALAGIIVMIPSLRMIIAIMMGLGVVFGICFFIPARPKARSLNGGAGYSVGKVEKFDERDTIFSRERWLHPGNEIYDEFYERHPDWKEADDRRRSVGGIFGRLGAIDCRYAPNNAMVEACAKMALYLALHSHANPDESVNPEKIDSAKVTEVIKGFAKHLGADLVGACKVNPLWVYSHRGRINPQLGHKWGEKIPEPLPYAVVIATEMGHDLVATGPHTPGAVESIHLYAKGAYITTILADWLASLGYRAVAHKTHSYDAMMVPLAVDAGLGELGRHGYLIADKFGARVRLFAVTTNMPLMPDSPIDLGAEVFCERCLKCAEACPSKSIPLGEKMVERGLLRWKLNPETCYDYWLKTGTDCSICMGICPFSRPNTPLHKAVKWFVRRSSLAHFLVPYVDSFLYGRKWKPREAPHWIDYPRGGKPAETLDPEKNSPDERSVRIGKVIKVLSD